MTSARWKFAPVVARDGKPLPGAGAFDPTGIAIPCGWAVGGVLYVRQTQSADAASAGQFLVEVSADDGEQNPSPQWDKTALVDGTITAIAGVGFTTPADAWVIRLPARSDGWAFPLELLGGATMVRIRCAEYGAVGSPCSIAARVILRGQ